jgi:arylformamidase
MPLIDISPPLRVGMAVFPGDAAFRVAKTFTIAPGCPVNVAEIAMSTHCGAHADAPLHYDPDGASIDELDLADFIGPARVVDARGKNPLCGFEEIAAALEGAPPRLLFRLMDRLDPMVWPAGFRALARKP